MKDTSCGDFEAVIAKRLFSVIRNPHRVVDFAATDRYIKRTEIEHLKDEGWVTTEEEI